MLSNQEECLLFGNQTNIPFTIMSVLAEQVVNRSTLFIFAKVGPVKALS